MSQLTPLQSLVASGTKLWLDSVDPKEVKANRALGATGATSNPIIIGDLIKTGQFDELITKLIREGKDDDQALAWHLTDHLVKEAQQVFLPVFSEHAPRVNRQHKTQRQSTFCASSLAAQPTIAARFCFSEASETRTSNLSLTSR